MGFLYFLSILIEIGILFYLEKKAWKTLLTPLNFLMLPYLVVLIVSIAISGRFDFVEFYFPSILIWNVGLLLFAIPSFALAGYARKNNYPTERTDIEESRIPLVFTLICVVLLMMFSYRLMSTIHSSQFLIGSDDFAEEFAGFGFWAHLKRFCVVMLMLCIYYVNKRQPWIWIFIIAFMVVSVINMVKGTMIIPVVVGVLLRLASGKMRITGRLVLTILIGALAVFFVSFGLAIVVVNDIDINGGVLLWIFQRFVHYFSSGTLGLSVDMELGFPDRGDFDVIWTPFINIYNQITGNKEVLSPVNPTFFFTGISLTNVRTVFGTLYIYTSPVQFALYTLGLSAFCYTLKIISVGFNNLFTCTTYYYFCALLAMGWFEFYFFHLDVVEIPAMIILLHVLDWMFMKKEKTFFPSPKGIILSSYGEIPSRAREIPSPKNNMLSHDDVVYNH
ncbi:MAG: hypothetical protein J5814_11055 [Bacteroidaceae bacterium]|nr:hypothetical protein [Bacteroidaceae bacterium]